MKALNVIGIILAWILSICLVLWLVVTPMVLSGLSFLEPETITKVVSSTLTGGAQSPSSSAKEDFVPVSAGMTCLAWRLTRPLWEKCWLLTR